MSKTAPIETDDLVVLLLGADSAGTPAGRIDGITRLEKLVFLIENELKPQWLDESADFISHHFGPFSAKVYDAVDVLNAASMISDSAAPSTSPEDSWEAEYIIGEDQYATRNFELTPRGREYYNALLQDLPKGVEEQISAFKSRFAGAPLRQLIRYVYQRFPDYTDKSLIRNDILE